jgi:predicted methyltransferase
MADQEHRNAKPRHALSPVRGLATLAAALALAACASGSGYGSSGSGGAAAASATLSPEAIANIVNSPDRAAADRENDKRRHPEQMLAFIGLRPGMVALDVSAGRGYTTELLARAVGPSGKVYGQRPPPNPNTPPPAPAAPEGQSHPTAAPPAPAVMPPLVDRLKNWPNMVQVLRRFDDPVPPEVAPGSLDLVTLMFNYHDFGYAGVNRAAMNAAVFAALKPGGLYVIADHAGRPGTGISESGTLHRVEEAFVRKEVEAAGFKLAQEGLFLRNPNDPRDKNTPDPAQPKDEFVLKFVKP